MQCLVHDQQRRKQKEPKGSAFCVPSGTDDFSAQLFVLPLKQDGRHLMKPEILKVCAGPLKPEMVEYSGGECLMVKQVWQPNIKQRSTIVFTGWLWLRDFGTHVHSRFLRMTWNILSFSNLHGQKPYWPYLWSWDGTVKVNMEQTLCHLEWPPRGEFFGLYFNEGLGRSAAGHTLAPRHLFLWYFPVLSLEDVIRKW